MKFLLTLIICSQVGNACLDPFPWQTTFNTQYDCLRFGYQESIKKLDEIGKDEVNKYGIYIKFYCSPSDTI